MSSSAPNLYQPRSFTSDAERKESHATLVETFATNRTKSLKWRKWQLKQLWWMLEDNEAAITGALASDLGRHELESMACDLHGLKNEILKHLSNLEKWAADEPVAGSGFVFGTLGRARIRKEPLGVVLVIGAWNFPFLLTLKPVIGAISAGCCVVIKPSELAMASQDLMSDLVNRYLDRSAIRLVTGGPEETQKLLELKFNHIFFTGSTKVARLVAAAAAKHLTPTVLELGGQGPAIITSRANLDHAAKRVAYVKFLNAGQICLSVNHVFADPKIYDEFVDRLIYWTKKFACDGRDSQMCKLINTRHFGRLASLLEHTDGKIFRVHESMAEEKDFSPVIVTGVTMQDSLLREELFGPICPVVKATYMEAIDSINSLPHALAIYMFSNDSSEVNEVLRRTVSGGVTVNDVLAHYLVPGAPFGGVGESGMGYYHGNFGFLAFTHQRTVVEMPTWLDKLMAFTYPPYDLRNKGKYTVKNRFRFRRGETMEDQKIGRNKAITSYILLGALAGIATWFSTLRWSR